MIEFMFDDLKTHFNNGYEHFKCQSVIGFKKLFRGFIVKCWGQTSTVKYYRECNRILVRESVNFYHKWRVDKNAVAHEPEIHKEILIKECKLLLDGMKGDKREKVRDHVRKYEDDDMEIKLVEVIAHWIEAARIFMKNISRHKEKVIFSSLVSR